MIFPNNKKTDVKYIIDIDRISGITVPKSMYKNIKTHNQEKRTGCPAVKSSADRLFYGFPPFSIEFEFGLNDLNEPWFRYNLQNSEVYHSDELKDLLMHLIRVTNNRNEFVDFQMQLPYCFVTDDKNLEVSTLPPINMETENVTYLTGSYKPYAWIRNQNSTFVLNDINKVGKIKFDYEKPCISYFFNKPINLEYSEITNDMQNFINQNKRILAFKEKLKDTYNTVLTRRPKYLLK